MPKLKDWPNIRTLGYVATNYTNKPLDTVLAEIQTYANWTSILNNTKMAVDGIFFDETPGAYDWKAHDFLKAAADEVRRQPRLGQQVVGTCHPPPANSRLPVLSPRTIPQASSPPNLPTLVHNPGAIPFIPWNYLDIANITVVFENTWTQWIDSTHYNDIKSLPANSNLTKDNFALMLHSVPSIPDDLLGWTAKAMKNMTGWNFVSSVGVAGEYWHSFSSVFGSWVSSYAAA
jgi:hypothetical protein